MSGEPCRLSVEEIVESGDLGDFVSLELSNFQYNVVNELVIL